MDSNTNKIGDPKVMSGFALSPLKGFDPDNITAQKAIGAVKTKANAVPIESKG